MCSYSKHKKKAEARGIGFEFTQEEYNYFSQKVRKVKFCPYSFNILLKPDANDTHAGKPSVERMDASKPYALENCIWVSRKGNSIKNRFFERCSESAPEKTTSTYNHWTVLNTLMQDPLWMEQTWFKQFSDCPKHLVPVKYRHLFPQYVYDEIQTSDTTTDKINTVIPVNIELQVTPTNKEEDTLMTALPTEQAPEQLTKYDFDVYVSKQYYFLYDMSVQASIDFEVTLSDVSKLLSRKTSSLDPKEIVSFFAGEEPKLFVKDPMKPLTKDNLLVVSKATLQKLIAMTTASGMSLVQMKQLLNNI